MRQQSPIFSEHENTETIYQVFLIQLTFGSEWGVITLSVIKVKIDTNLQKYYVTCVCALLLL